MKKNFWRLLSLTLLTFSLTFTSCSDDGDEMESTLKFEDLPMVAQTFINTYFTDLNVLSVKEITANNITVYEVGLEGGYEIVFNQDGAWDQVEAPDKTEIPNTGFIPQVIRNYVRENYSGYGINEINRTGEGYKVELVTGLDLYFNQSGECYQVGNDY